MNESGKPLSLEQCVRISDTLDTLLLPSFGPNATHNLLSTSSGKLMITSSGRAILQSLHLAHPVGKLLIDTVVSFHNLAGDGSKCFIAVTAEALRRIEKHIESCCKEKDGINPRRSSERLAIAKSITKIKLNVLPTIQSKLIRCIPQKCLNPDKNTFDGTMEICRSTMWTCLQGRFNAETRQTLVNLAGEFISKCCYSGKSLSFVLQNTIDRFDLICVDSPGQPVMNSRVLDGVVIPRNFHSGISPALPLSDVKFVLLDCQIESTIPTESVAHIRLTSIEQSKSSLLWKSHRVNRIIDILKRLHVKLVLSSELFSESTLLVFAQRGVFVIHSVDEDNFDHMIHTSATLVTHEESDLLVDPERVVGHANRIDTVVAGGRTCVLIKLPDRDPAENTPSLSMLLCGPTPGTCDQFAAVLLGAFKSALMAIHPLEYISLEENWEEYKEAAEKETVSSQDVFANRPHPALVCPGGGGFEMAVHSLLKDHAASCTQDVVLSLTCDVLSEALLSVPLRLLQNSYSPQRNKATVAQLHKLCPFYFSTQNHRNSTVSYNSQVKANRSLSCEGIDARTGTTLLTDTRIIEPLAGKILMLYHVLELLQQLLRIDYLVPVLQLAPTTHDQSNCDSENDE